MTSLESLIVCTDLSARSDRAVERALRLARERGGRLTVLHVVDDELPARTADAQRAEARQQIAEHLAGLDAAPGADVEIAVVFGRGSEVIVAKAEEVGAGMVVLGTPRRSGLTEAFRGTTADRVARSSTVPVLMVRDRATRAYGRVLAAVDFSPSAARTLRIACDLVPHGRFHLVHVASAPFRGPAYGRPIDDELTKREAMDVEHVAGVEFAAFLDGMPVPSGGFHTAVVDGGASEVLREQAAALKPDLLALGTRGHGAVARFLLGSVALDMLSDPPCDVLVAAAG